MTPYPEEVERTMKRFYDSLSEKDRRRYAGANTSPECWVAAAEW